MLHKKNENISKTANELVKVGFSLSVQESHSHAKEVLWAEKVADDKYVLLNSPFYVYGFSYMDKVIANVVEGENLVSGIADYGGHSTYRIFLSDDNFLEKNNPYWKELNKLGCTFEQATEHLYSIDVPPSVNVSKVYKLLEKGQEEKKWEFEEGHYFRKDK